MYYIEYIEKRRKKKQTAFRHHNVFVSSSFKDTIALNYKIQEREGLWFLLQVHSLMCVQLCR